MSTLSISSAMVFDSGNYSCSLPDYHLSDEVEVSVQSGDHFEQLRPSSSSYTETADPCNIVIVMLVYRLCTVSPSHTVAEVLFSFYF